MLFRVIISEIKKTRWSVIIQIIFVTIALSTFTGISNYMFRNPDEEKWLWYLIMSLYFYGSMLFPLLAGILAALICRYEHIGGGWKQLLALPVTRTQVYLSKYLMIIFFLALTQLLLLVAIVVGGTIIGIEEPIPWGMMLKSVITGWVAILPLAALQLWFSILLSNFALPMTINVIFSIPAMLISQSEMFGPYYPWAQPFLGMMPTGYDFLNVSFETLLYVILGGWILSFFGGLITFNRRDMV